ncbi:Tripartite ATP-independent periplasmic transporter DctQ component [uncultured delta proteobacterium]|uniref:Tripartite ATP-independent periplasmic transporter DctQ component n=1 Tax=uncultured delta proteobacterium TaxID=34034 RepID=A0A212KDU1_9DELT|nr:Tripartite ATP-independent periplasmic transporter DctQ component [uncultured delta proteobacterium]
MVKYIWDHLEEIFLLPSLVFSVILIFVQVIMRYIFGNSLSWSEELARYLFVWQIWLGVSYAARNRTHLRITIVKDRLSPNAQKILELAVTAVWVGFGLFVAYKGSTLVMKVARFNQLSSALQIPMMYVHMAVPVGCGLMVIRLIENVMKAYVFGKGSMEALDSSYKDFMPDENDKGGEPQ